MLTASPDHPTVTFALGVWFGATSTGEIMLRHDKRTLTL